MPPDDAAVGRPLPLNRRKHNEDHHPPSTGAPFPGPRRNRRSPLIADLGPAPASRAERSASGHATAATHTRHPAALAPAEREPRRRPPPPASASRALPHPGCAEILLCAKPHINMFGGQSPPSSPLSLSITQPAAQNSSHISHQRCCRYPTAPVSHIAIDPVALSLPSCYVLARREARAIGESHGRRIQVVHWPVRAIKTGATLIRFNMSSC